METVYLDGNEIPLREVLLKYASIDKEELEREGFKCCCPIHNDSTPSFKVFTKTNTFYCFGCGIAGGPKDLVRMLLKLGSNDEAEEVLKKEYNIEDDAIPSIEGLCQRKGLSVGVVTEMLGWVDVEQGIKIPYMGLLPEQQGNNYPTYKIRSSYTGKKGRPKYYKDGENINIPYGLNLVASYNRELPLYITEGETDMITLLQAGYQAIGIPGANAFKQDFVKILDTFGSIVVVLDNDEAGRHLLDSMMRFMGSSLVKLTFLPMPNGIKDINTFHCTTCYKDIEKFKNEFKKMLPVPVTLEGFRLLKERLQEGYNIVTEYNISNYIKYIIGDNRIEADKFVKGLYNLEGKEQGITVTTIKDVAKNAMAAMMRESEEAQEELIASMGDKLIDEGDDCYVYKRITMQGIKLEPFTSFTVKVLRRELNDDTGEITAVWKLENNNGRTEEVIIGPAERASGSKFTETISMQDGFMYRIPPVAGFHNLFMYYIESRTRCPLVHKCSEVGKHKDVWLFDEFGIDKDGKVSCVENGSYNLGGENYIPPVAGMPRDMYRARVAMPVPATLNGEAVKALLQTLEVNQGSKIAWVILGWIASCFAKDRIQAMGWGFPVCYITGNAQSGKTTLAKWLMKTAGFRDSTALGAKSTVFGINMMSSMYSNLPLWFDDIRSLGEDGIWNTIILGAYENSGDVKGTKNMKLNMNIEYKSGLLITSEFFVKSPAAQSRCLQLVADETEQNRTLYSAINAEVDRILPYLGVNTIVKLQGEMGKFEEKLQKCKEYLVSKGLNSRFAQNYAVVLVGFATMFGDFIKEDDQMWITFVEYVASLGKENDLDTTSNSYAMELVKDIGAIMQDRYFKEQYKQAEDWEIKNNMLYLKSTTLYDVWRKYKGYNTTTDYNSRREFVAQLRRLPFAMRNKGGIARIGGKVQVAICWDLEKMKECSDIEIQLLPDALAEMDTSEFI